ncbi:hypothetical protein [Streptomyces chattanoogensis]|uniref:Lipoprotein n=1 Tax=Streptomyces chattanoogensis TaxID=66876 RepID=A0A0N0XZ43_9ACTN|nr:hypothetical protein [Streptomyces chattanoogensis]AJT65043.1 hypothetical protein T261_3373 [Streptomyces lydicus]KPC66246.1 lipoprotein [Streptomyces chattanoogensis]
MTAALISRGKGRRTAAAIGAVSLGLLTLSACEKPTALATVTAGSSTVSAEATPGCDGGEKALDKVKFTACISKEGGKTLTVSPGEKVRIGVEPDIAKRGWLAFAGDGQGVSKTHQTYRTLDSSQLFVKQDPQTQRTYTVDTVTLQVAEYPKEGGQIPSAIFHFTLKQKD